MRLLPKNPLVAAGVILGVAIIVLGGLLVWASTNDGGSTKVAERTPEERQASRRTDRELKLEAKIEAARQIRAEQRRQEEGEARVRKAGIDGSPDDRTEATKSSQSKNVHPSRSAGSFAALENEVPGEIGVAYAPLGSTETQALGSLQVGHAWSSFKVPISVTVMLEQGGSFSSAEESLVASAITASDNEAAAALFAELESMTGGGASVAVEKTLADAGAPTVVSTAPPPPGAVSSWGQTEWELSASTRFYNALACDAYGGQTETIIADMENVIPEQQWGLGQASFPSGTSVAFKAGWGPDGSESGPYLVRQAGIVRSSQGGAVVTIAAQDSSGSFEAGVSDLNRVADWVARNVPLSGDC